MDKSYQPRADLLAGRVILITGAGDGIGRTAAINCAALGAEVILLGRTISKLEAVYDEIETAHASRASIYPLDLESASNDAYTQMCDVLNNNYQRLDGLLHNASILGDRVPIEDYDTNTWARVMQVNLNAVFMMTRALLPLMHRSRDASIVFTGSGVGRIPRAYWGAYCVSKYAIEGFSKLLADELENTSKIRVNTINPGATRTKMRADAFPGEDPAAIKEPHHIMAAYAFLLGPDSKGTHGQSIDAQDKAWGPLTVDR